MPNLQVAAQPNNVQPQLSVAPVQQQSAPLTVAPTPAQQQASLPVASVPAAPQPQSLPVTDMPQGPQDFKQPIPFPRIAQGIPEARKITSDDGQILNAIVAKYPDLHQSVMEAMSRGATPTQILNTIQQKYSPEAPKAPGLGQRIIQGVASAPARVAATVFDLGAGVVSLGRIGVDAATGNQADITKTEQQFDSLTNKGGAQDAGYLGKVKPVQIKVLAKGSDGNYGAATGADFSKSLLDSAGAGAELGSNFIGLEGAGSVAENIGKTGIMKAIGKGAGYGAAAGATAGAGGALQANNVTPGRVALGAIEGGAAGGILGAGLSGLGEGATKLIKGVTTAAKQPVDTLINSLAENYKSILNVGSKISNTEAATGRDTALFLAKEAIPLKVADGKLDATAALDALHIKAETENTLFDNILKSENKYLSLDEIEANAKRAVTAQGTDRTKALSHITAEMDAYKSQYASKGVPGGKGDLLLPMDQVNNIKKDIWSKTNNFGFEDANVKNATNKTLGSAFKSTIEQNLTDVNAKAFNNRLGDIQQAISTLTDRNGKNVAGGGKMNGYIMKLVGAVAGGAHGGPFGALEGAYAADKITKVLTDAQIPANVKLKLLNYLKSTEGGVQILKDAQGVLDARMKAQLGRKGLPEPGSIGMGPRSGLNADYQPIIDRGMPATPPPPLQLQGAGQNPIQLGPAATSP